MIQYNKTIQFAGDVDAAMTMAKTIFGLNGFNLNQTGLGRLCLTGPGMTSTKQNPILGLSRGELTFTGEALELTGELGGVAFMKKFLYLFPPALVVVMMVIFMFTNPDQPVGFTPLWSVVPWIVLSPVLSKYIQKKTEDAIATTLDSISKA
jgi:hypothetical protein